MGNLLDKGNDQFKVLVIGEVPPVPVPGTPELFEDIGIEFLHCRVGLKGIDILPDFSRIHGACRKIDLHLPGPVIDRHVDRHPERVLLRTGERGIVEGEGPVADPAHVPDRDNKIFVHCRGSRFFCRGGCHYRFRFFFVHGFCRCRGCHRCNRTGKAGRVDDNLDTAAQEYQDTENDKAGEPGELHNEPIFVVLLYFILGFCFDG